MTTLYLIRHGLAVDREPDQPDADRPLTSAGIQKTRQVAARLVASGLSCDWLLTSPLVRAYQTAQILVESRWLANGCDRRAGDKTQRHRDRLGGSRTESQHLGGNPDLGRVSGQTDP
jgi:broad specificity phosphatase PhoE